MFQKLRTRLRDWVDRRLQKEIDRLHAEGLRLKAEVLESTGGAPIRLTPEEHARLDALRKKIDPADLKKIDLLADAE